MFSNIVHIDKIFFKLIGVLVITMMLKSCGVYRKTDAREFPPEPEKRIQKNLEEGRGFRVFGNNKNQGGTFNFATSNEMWRASLDVLDFMPLISADYSGGLIITDWYSSKDKKNESVKISIRFLTNEIRSDALDIKVFIKECGSEANCEINQNNTNISDELKVAILKRAAKYKKEIVDNQPKKPKRTVGSIYPGG